MYTSKTRGLFHKAICCSGSCLSIGQSVFFGFAFFCCVYYIFGLCFSAFTKDLSAVRQKFLQKLEITETEPEKIIKTLQEVPIEKILKVQEEFVVRRKCSYTVNPRLIFVVYCIYAVYMLNTTHPASSVPGSYWIIRIDGLTEIYIYRNLHYTSYTVITPHNPI